MGGSAATIFLIGIKIELGWLIAVGKDDDDDHLHVNLKNELGLDVVTKGYLRGDEIHYVDMSDDEYEYDDKRSVYLCVYRKEVMADCNWEKATLPPLKELLDLQNSFIADIYQRIVKFRYKYSKYDFPDWPNYIKFLDALDNPHFETLIYTQLQ